VHVLATSQLLSGVLFCAEEIMFSAFVPFGIGLPFSRLIRRCRSIFIIMCAVIFAAFGAWYLSYLWNTYNETADWTINRLRRSGAILGIACGLTEFAFVFVRKLRGASARGFEVIQNK
jgi:hypothetical protein